MSIELPAVVGDPAGMHALAAALRSTASTVAGLDASVWGKVGSLAFEGPAATRLAATIRAWHGDVSGVAQSLQSTADMLDRSAAIVEAEQIARARLLRQLEEEALRDRTGASR